jgi:N-acetylglucosamine-6-phosphate deacetylase
LKTLFTAKTLFTPLERIEKPFVLVEDGRIVEVGSRVAHPMPVVTSAVDFGEFAVAPGLIDMHIHGGAGRDIMEADASALPTLETLLAAHGVTSYFPTTVTAPLDKTLAALERLANAVENPPLSGTVRARPVGIHMEGPFISHARRGVHPPQHLIEPTLAIFERFWEAARGHIRVMTIAPELNGAIEVISEAAKRGVCVSMGHSDADLQTSRAAIQRGACHATHTFNAMRPLGHRDPGLLTQILLDTTVSADIIADGIHVHPAVVELFLRLKGPERAVLITDATAATGMPPGKFHMGDFEFEVKDGKCLANGILAGSTLTMDRAVRNVMEFAGWSLQDALRAATANPATATALEGRGVLKLGAAADLVVLTPSGEVRNAVIAGRVVQ